MNARTVIDEMAQYYVGPMRPYDETHVEDVELKFYDRRRFDQKWYFTATVYHKGKIYRYRINGSLSERLINKVKTVSSRTWKGFEDKIQLNPLLWKLYTENIKPQFTAALNDVNAHLSLHPERRFDGFKFIGMPHNRDKPIESYQFLGPSVRLTPRKPDEVLTYPWLTRKELIDFLDVEGFRYIDTISQYGIEMSTRRGREIGAKDPQHRLATFLNKLERPGDSLLTIKSSQSVGELCWVLMNPEERKRFGLEIKRMARNRVKDLLSHEDNPDLDLEY